MPLLVKDSDRWTREILPPRNVNGVNYRIQRYRPRIEGLFARIERWTKLDDEADISWRSISKDNITTCTGKLHKVGLLILRIRNELSAGSVP